MVAVFQPTNKQQVLPFNHPCRTILLAHLSVPPLPSQTQAGPTNMLSANVPLLAGEQRAPLRVCIITGTARALLIALRR